MNRMFGITGIMVKFFVCRTIKDADELNIFLAEHNGNIIDIQYQQGTNVMVVYKNR